MYDRMRGLERRGGDMDKRLLMAALAAALCAAGPADAGKRDDTLRFAGDQVPESMDPYMNNVRLGVIIAHHVWDHLIYRDPKTNEYKGRSRPAGTGSTTRRSSSSCAGASSSTTARHSTPTTWSTRSTSCRTRRTRWSRSRTSTGSRAPRSSSSTRSASVAQAAVPGRARVPRRAGGDLSRTSTTRRSARRA